MQNWAHNFATPKDIVFMLNLAEKAVMPLIAKLDEACRAGGAGAPDVASMGVLLALTRRMALEGADMKEVAQLIEHVGDAAVGNENTGVDAKVRPLRVITGGKRTNA